MRDVKAENHVKRDHKSFSSVDELAKNIETLRHVIMQVRELSREDRGPGKVNEDRLRLPQEAWEFHTRKEIILAERQIRDSVTAIFGTSSSIGVRYQNYRIKGTSQTVLNETIGGLESLIFQIEKERLEVAKTFSKPTPDGMDIDPLTDLYSRRMLERCISHELDRSQRYGYSCTLVVFSLSNWTALKNIHGSALANAVAVSMACACKASLRGYDYAARIANDEFAVFLPQADTQCARAVSRRIAEIFDEDTRQLCENMDLHVEFGTAAFPFDGENHQSLLHTAMSHRMSFAEDMTQVKMPA